jgi:hypothetical protein
LCLGSVPIPEFDFSLLLVLVLDSHEYETL